MWVCLVVSKGPRVCMPHVVFEYSGRQDEHFLDKKIANVHSYAKYSYESQCNVVKEDDNLPVPDLFRVEVNLPCSSLLLD